MPNSSDIDSEAPPQCTSSSSFDINAPEVQSQQQQEQQSEYPSPAPSPTPSSTRSSSSYRAARATLQQALNKAEEAIKLDILGGPNPDPRRACDLYAQSVPLFRIVEPKLRGEKAERIRNLVSLPQQLRSVKYSTHPQIQNPERDVRPASTNLSGDLRVT